MVEHEMQEVFQFARDRAIEEVNNLPWYQQYPDISIPLLFIFIGLFQFVIRKWLFPVAEEIMDELESQMPTQGLFYNPAFGVFIMVIGVILMLVLNLDKIL